MKKLEREIKANGHVYRQIARTESKAIYSQHTKDGMLAGHEVFFIKIGKESTMPNGTVLPERELFPKDNDFGSTAWSVGIDLEYAMKKYNEL